MSLKFVFNVSCLVSSYWKESHRVQWSSWGGASPGFLLHCHWQGDHLDPRREWEQWCYWGGEQGWLQWHPENQGHEGPGESWCQLSRFSGPWFLLWNRSDCQNKHGWAESLEETCSETGEDFRKKKEYIEGERTQEKIWLQIWRILPLWYSYQNDVKDLANKLIRYVYRPADVTKGLKYKGHKSCSIFISASVL